MRKYACNLKTIDNKLANLGFDSATVFYPRTSHFLLFSALKINTFDRYYFIYDKYRSRVLSISMEVYFEYLYKIDDFDSNTIFKLSRLSKYTFRGEK